MPQGVRVTQINTTAVNIETMWEPFQKIGNLSGISIANATAVISAIAASEYPRFTLDHGKWVKWVGVE